MGLPAVPLLRGCHLLIPATVRERRERNEVWCFGGGRKTRQGMGWTEREVKASAAAQFPLPLPATHAHPFPVVSGMRSGIRSTGEQRVGRPQGATFPSDFLCFPCPARDPGESIQASLPQPTARALHCNRTESNTNICTSLKITEQGLEWPS